MQTYLILSTQAKYYANYELIKLSTDVELLTLLLQNHIQNNNISLISNGWPAILNIVNSKPNLKPNFF